MFFIVLFSLSLYLFRGAFATYFFSDDFFFLKISKIQSISQFIHFFSPIKGYFYRPLSTEVFYFIIHILKEGVFLSHILVFVVYFIGLYVLYKTTMLLAKNKLLSYLLVGLYAVNLTHVFQLYFFGTFQEVAAFTFLVVSFYYFLKKKTAVSLVFFLFALFSND